MNILQDISSGDTTILPQKLPRNFYCGVEILHRDSDFPFRHFYNFAEGNREVA